MTAEEMRAIAIAHAESRYLELAGLIGRFTDRPIMKESIEIAMLAIAHVVRDIRTIPIPPPLQAPPRVKPLVWRSWGDGTLTAGDYTIRASHSLGPGKYFLSRGSKVLAWSDTQEPIEAAAQADHERRILAALEGGE